MTSHPGTTGATNRTRGEGNGRRRGAARRRGAKRWLLAGTALVALLSTHCGVDRSGTAPWRPTLDARPTYLCPDEPVEVAWDARTSITGADFTFTLTARPGGVVSSWAESPHRTREVPRPPADPGGIQETTYTGVFTLQRGDRGPFMASASDQVVVIGPEATYPHLETFRWSCDGAPGGGPGYSRVDYDEGDLASQSVQLLRIRNLSSVPVDVGLSRGGEAASVRLAPGETSPTEPPPSGFLGPAWGIFYATPEDLDGYGPTGCDEGAEPGDVMMGGDEEPVIVRPRPDLQLELTLGCQP